MNLIFKMMMWSILLNLSVGILTMVIVDSTTGAQLFSTSWSRYGLNYSESTTTTFTSGMNSTVNPSGTLQDKGNTIYRILDMMNLGFIANFLSTVNNYLFGMVNLLESIFGGFFPAATSFWLFTALRGIIGVFYMIGAFVLWTGRDIQS